MNQQDETGPLLLRPREAAKVLAISERKLWEHTVKCDIPCIRMGKSVRYRPEALRRWLEELESARSAALR